jgi:hypothetical protein
LAWQTEYAQEIAAICSFLAGDLRLLKPSQDSASYTLGGLCICEKAAVAQAAARRKRVNETVGYRWWTVTSGAERHGLSLKLGPFSFNYYEWTYSDWQFGAYFWNRRLFFLPRLRRR